VAKRVRFLQSSILERNQLVPGLRETKETENPLSSRRQGGARVRVSVWRVRGWKGGEKRVTFRAPRTRGCGARGTLNFCGWYGAWNAGSRRRQCVRVWSMARGTALTRCRLNDVACACTTAATIFCCTAACIALILSRCAGGLSKERANTCPPAILTHRCWVLPLLPRFVLLLRRTRKGGCGSAAKESSKLFPFQSPYWLSASCGSWSALSSKQGG